MTTGTDNDDPQNDGQGRWRSPLLIGLGILVLALVGTIIGFIASGGLDDEPAVAGPTTTVSSPVQTSGTPPPTIQPPTTTPPSATTGPPLGPAPDTSVEGQITYSASEDTFTNTSEIDETEGFRDVISIENDPPELKLGLIKFDVSDFPTDASVGSASLRLTIVFPPDQPVTVHAVDGDWTETETSAGNAPLIGDVIATIPAGGAIGDEIQVDVTSAVAGVGVVDFYLSTIGDNSIEFSSKEGGAGPRLTVVLG